MAGSRFYYKAGLDYYSVGDYANSVKSFLEYAKIEHSKGRNLLGYHYWSFWNNLGNSFTELGKYAKAETCYLNAVKCFQKRKPLVDAGIVFFNYACMLFFYKKDPNDLYKAYFLFSLADKVGFKNIYAKKMNEQVIQNALIYKESVNYFFKSRIYNELKKYPYIRKILR